MSTRIDSVPLRTGWMYGLLAALLAVLAPHVLHIPVWVSIAVTGLERMPELPDVPTVAESGVPGFEVLGWKQKQAEGQLRARPEVKNLFSVLGFNFAGNGSNRAVIFASLQPISERAGDEHSAMALVRDMQRKLGVS